MNKTIIELIVEDQSAKAVSAVQRTLAKKLIQAISEEATKVAKVTYGTIRELYGGDETPQFINPSDNAYAVFFANALKKFGVTGPQDFTDDAAKQQFFQYVDNNWRAQDAVQGSSAPTGATTELGTQTALPPTATQPTVPSPDTQPQSGVDNSPSVATMAPAGPTIDNQQPLGPQGSDPNLNNAQAAQSMGAPAPGAGGGEPCPHCNGTGQVQSQVCPTCGQSTHGGEDQDPDLEIGDEDYPEDGDQTDFSQDPDDEMATGNGSKPSRFGGDDDLDQGDAQEFGNGGDEGDEGDEQGDEDQGEEEGDVDDPFDDEDAYNVDHQDFMPKHGDDDEDEDEQGEPDDSDDEYGYDEDGDDDGSEDEDDDGNEYEEDDDDSDPDLEVSDDDDSDDDSAPPKKKSFGKIPEDFGFELDNAEDAVYISEKLDLFGKAKQDLKSDPSLHPEMRKQRMGALNDGLKRVKHIQGQLDQIRGHRDGLIKTLQKQRQLIKSDPGKSPEEKHKALKHLAQMAAQNRAHFKQQAKSLKAIHTGQLGESIEEGIFSGLKRFAGLGKKSPLAGQKKPAPLPMARNPIRPQMAGNKDFSKAAVHTVPNIKPQKPMAGNKDFSKAAIHKIPAFANR